MRKFHKIDGVFPSIADRLAYIRNIRNFTLDEVARLFNVYKSTVLRWESPGYWKVSNTSSKRLLLMQLAELYQADYDWVLNGKLFRSLTAKMSWLLMAIELVLVYDINYQICLINTLQAIRFPGSA